jgi:RNA polymerase sigma factor (sigma-70 family)
MVDDPRSDEHLLALGDEESFAVFYRRHAAAVLAYMMRRTGRAEMAADLTAETFAAVLEGASRFDPSRGTASQWLYGIAHHLLSRALQRGSVERRARERYGIGRIALDDEAIERIHELATSDVARTRLDDELQALPADQREALHARVVDERDYRDIAQSMSVSESTVRQRVSRALARLRANLGSAE